MSTEKFKAVKKHVRRPELSALLAAKPYAHAYLFAGPKGIGKATAARAFAAGLLCEQETGCGSCRPCRLLERGTHPDYLELAAEGSLSIEVIRGVSRHLTLSRHSGRYKVVVIDGAGAMTPEAQNAFLKTLEEPTKHTIIVLIAESERDLLETISSRCRIVRFRLVPRELIEQALQERGADEKTAAFLSVVALGRPGIAFRYLEDKERFKRVAELVDVLGGVLGTSFGERLLAAEELVGDPEHLREALHFFLVYLRDILMAKIGCGHAIVLRYRRKELEAQAGELLVSTVIEAIVTVRNLLLELEGATNERLRVEAALLSLPQVTV